MGKIKDKVSRYDCDGVNDHLLLKQADIGYCMVSGID